MFIRGRRVACLSATFGNFVVVVLFVFVVVFSPTPLTR